MACGTHKKGVLIQVHHSLVFCTDLGITFPLNTSSGLILVLKVRFAIVITYEEPVAGES